MLLFAFLGALVAFNLQKKTRFDGFKVVEVPQADGLLQFTEDNLIDVWSQGDVWTLFISPEQLAKLKKSFLKGINVLGTNVQEQIDQETLRLSENYQPFSFTFNKDWFQEYHRYEDIKSWYMSLANAYPEIVKFIPSIGKTHEGRDIFAVVISGKKQGDKKQVFIQSGQHAREWIGPATTQFMMYKFIHGYGSDAEITALLDAVAFHHVPVMNPDGYEYTWSNNRMWRKNKRPGRRAIGVDLNRNWGKKFFYLRRPLGAGRFLRRPEFRCL